MLKKLLMAGALLLAASNCTPKTVTVTRYPEPCHVPVFPAFPDVNPQALADPNSLTPDKPALVVFSIPDFTQLGEWVKEVADWKTAVSLCPYVTDRPAPASPAKQALGISAWRYHNSKGIDNAE